MPALQNSKHLGGTIKWPIAILLALFLSGVTGCASWKTGAEKNVVENGIQFELFNESKDGRKLGTLARDMVIQGWPARKDFVVFHPDWRLDELHLFRDFERNGIFMPVGTRVFPNEQGNPGVVCFSRDTEVQGYIIKGNRSGGYMTGFYPNGRLKWFYPRDPVVIDEITCTDSLWEEVQLYPDGRLRQCKLGKSVSIAGTEYSSGSVIRLDQSGNVTVAK